MTSRDNSSNIKEPQSTTIPDDETTLVSPTPDLSTDSLHSQPYPSSQPSLPSDDDSQDSQDDGCPTICIIICISSIIILILIIIIINNIGVVHDKDISRIPLNYELSLKRLYSVNYRYDYVIKGEIFNNNENKFISKRENINNNSSFTNLTSTSNTTNNTTNTTNTTNFVLAELISRSFIVIPAGWYEVQEFRYDKDSKLIRKVLTTECHIEFGLSSIWSAPNVVIQFTTYPTLNLTKELTLQESMKYCKWKITWTFIMNGYIHKSCPKNINILKNNNNTENKNIKLNNNNNNTENKNITLFDNQGYEKVAYFKGFEYFGFSFLSLDSTINYGYTTTPNLFKMMSRSVYITKDAPFPPIIPAIYTAYYSFITSSRSSNRSNRHKKNKS